MVWALTSLGSLVYKQKLLLNCLRTKGLTDESTELLGEFCLTKPFCIWQGF